MASCINQLNAPTKNFPVGVDLKRPLYSSVISKNLQSNAASQLLELLPTKRAFTVDPYKSLRVAADFFYYLLQNCGYIKRISTAESWAVSIVDAFVYSVVRNHSISINKGKAKVWHSAIIKCGWDGALELFPITLKDLISRAMSLSIDRPNKNWPSDVLTMIGRRDIAGKTK